MIGIHTTEEGDHLWISFKPENIARECLRIEENQSLGELPLDKLMISDGEIVNIVHPSNDPLYPDSQLSSIHFRGITVRPRDSLASVLNGASLEVKISGVEGRSKTEQTLKSLSIDSMAVFNRMGIFRKVAPNDFPGIDVQINIGESFIKQESCVVTFNLLKEDVLIGNGYWSFDEPTCTNVIQCDLRGKIFTHRTEKMFEEIHYHDEGLLHEVTYPPFGDEWSPILTCLSWFIYRLENGRRIPVKRHCRNRSNVPVWVCNYSNSGLKHGIECDYYSNGSPKIKRIWENGFLIKRVEYYYPFVYSERPKKLSMWDRGKKLYRNFDYSMEKMIAEYWTDENSLLQLVPPPIQRMIDSNEHWTFPTMS